MPRKAKNAIERAGKIKGKKSKNFFGLTIRIPIAHIIASAADKPKKTNPVTMSINRILTKFKRKVKDYKSSTFQF